MKSKWAQVKAQERLPEEAVKGSEEERERGQVTDEQGASPQLSSCLILVHLSHTVISPPQNLKEARCSPKPSAGD